MLLANMLLLDASLNGTLWALQLEVLMAPIIVLFYFLERSYGTRVLVAAAVTSGPMPSPGSRTTLMRRA